MITGVVRGREAIVQLSIRGSRGRKRNVDAVIDTGYTASLSLPPAVIASLGLHWQSTGRGILADGSECLFDVFVAEVAWDGKTFRVLVDEADTDPLIGMALLSGYELNIQVRPFGKVKIKRLARRSSAG
jgi:clan AA aspartic protease